MNFKEILEQKMVENPDRYIPPNVNIGGWNKFIKTEINITKNGPSNNEVHRRRDAYRATEKNSTKQETQQQSKKGGRGWLHKT